MTGETVLPEKRLFRGGTTRAIYESAVIDNPKRILDFACKIDKIILKGKAAE
jgi:hypothetical protein